MLGPLPHMDGVRQPIWLLSLLFLLLKKAEGSGGYAWVKAEGEGKNVANWMNAHLTELLLWVVGASLFVLIGQIVLYRTLLKRLEQFEEDTFKYLSLLHQRLERLVDRESLEHALSLREKASVRRHHYIKQGYNDLLDRLDQLEAWLKRR